MPCLRRTAPCGQSSREVFYPEDHVSVSGVGRGGGRDVDGGRHLLQHESVGHEAMLEIPYSRSLRGPSCRSLPADASTNVALLPLDQDTPP